MTDAKGKYLFLQLKAARRVDTCRSRGLFYQDAAACVRVLHTMYTGVRCLETQQGHEALPSQVLTRSYIIHLLVSVKK